MIDLGKILEEEDLVSLEMLDPEKFDPVKKTIVEIIQKTKDFSLVNMMRFGGKDAALTMLNLMQYYAHNKQHKEMFEHCNEIQNRR